MKIRVNGVLVIAGLLLPSCLLDFEGYRERPAGQIGGSGGSGGVGGNGGNVGGAANFGGTGGGQTGGTGNTSGSGGAAGAGGGGGAAGTAAAGASGGDSGASLCGDGCPAGEKLCAGTCVPNAPNFGCGCGSGGCTDCPAAPANAKPICEGLACGFECNSGYKKTANGLACEPV